MNNEKNDKYYIEKILKDLKFISEHIEGVSVVYQTVTQDVPWLIEEIEKG